MFKKTRVRQIIELLQKNLYHLFYPDKFNPKNSYAPVDYAYVHSELSKVGVTEVLLWEEYCEKCEKEGVKFCSYPTVARGYKRYTVSKNYTSHVEHKPGVTLEVDCSGPTMSYIDLDKNTQCTHTSLLQHFPIASIHTLKLQHLFMPAEVRKPKHYRRKNVIGNSVTILLTLFAASPR